MPGIDGVWFSRRGVARRRGGRAPPDRVRPVLGTLLQRSGAPSRSARSSPTATKRSTSSTASAKSSARRSTSRRRPARSSGRSARSWRARRSSIMVFDEALGRLRVVATRGFPAADDRGERRPGRPRVGGGARLPRAAAGREPARRRRRRRAARLPGRRLPLGARSSTPRRAARRAASGSSTSPTASARTRSSRATASW